MKNYKDLLWVLFCCLIGLALRLDFLNNTNWGIDSDEAIVGLMGKHILEGRGIPVFYYGQNYMGSLEAILASLSFKVFGLSSFSLKLVPLIFSILLIPAVFLLGAEVSPFTAQLAPLFMAICPSTLMNWSSKARGGFIEIVFIGVLALLLTVRWFNEKGISKFRFISICMLVGLGWWTNNQIIYFLIPISILVLLKAISEYQVLFLFYGLIAFLMGGLPFWLYNLKHDFASFGLFKFSEPSEIWTHVKGFFSIAFLILAGAKRSWHQEDIYAGASILVAGTYLLLLVTAVVPKQELDCENSYRRSVAVNSLLIFVLGIVAVYCVSSFGYFAAEPRYLLPLYPGLFILASYSIERLLMKTTLWGLFFVVMILSINIMSSYLGGRVIPGQPLVQDRDRVARDHAPLINWLRSHGYKYVKTDYWIGYRLAFETNEEIKFSVFKEPHDIRIPEYEREVAAVPSTTVPLIIVPSQLPLVQEALDCLGVPFFRADIGEYIVIYGFDINRAPLVPISLSNIDVTSDFNDAAAVLAIDGDLSTRWGTSHPQVPGMNFTITFKTPTIVRGIRYFMGGWPQDDPEALTIVAQLSDGTTRRVLETAQHHAIKYLIDDATQFVLYFPAMEVKKLILTQEGTGQIFDWSIAELEVME